MAEDQRSIEIGRAAVQDSSQDLPGIRNLGRIDVFSVQSRTQLLRATGPRSNHMSVMRLPRGEIRGVGNTGARSLTPEADRFQEVNSAVLTGGVIFEPQRIGEIEA